MVYETKVGTFDISEENVINFKNGIPGFENLRKFAVISLAETEPIKWLVSLEDKNIALPVVDPWIAFSDYSINLNQSVLDELENPAKEHVLVFCVISLKEPVTINLIAPIIINLEKGIGMQVILEGTNYSVKEPIKARD
ncbi:MAG: flagellar assembly protein FliW [Mesoaciditoga sp.]|uniref:flagellar assembly protein FliW n=1 Tax=Athalassotoga sp. TaxID=2022597 RepID=UPI000CAAD0C9|nr:MAG: flagellar assembly protein FliW [Mesoaciditoga sp.]PMP78712.1 MAG: flagellar assembly protein FliW [Mesoaciditoga sp.]HEU24293.1 flagellar assembly protein FliW [Mesoaciditoga lauensis]